MKSAAHSQTSPQLLQFRYDLNDGSSSAVQRYEDYLGRISIEARDVLQLVRQLHKSVWSKGLLARNNPEGAEHLRRLLDRYYSRQLPPSPNATTTLLGICRDRGAYENGIELWTWAESQGPEAVSISTYGAAIELYAAAGQSPIACEELFKRALKEYSTGFNTYLMYPNSVLSAPERQIMSPGVSNALLAAIARVRFSSRDWISAYLAIDSMLKLRPDCVSSHTTYMILEYRPLEEALRTFRLICLGGSKVAETATFQLSQRLRLVQESDLKPADPRFHHGFLASIAQINLLHIALATGQPLSEGLASMILLSMLANLPRRLDKSDKETRDRFKNLATLLMDTTLKMFMVMGLSTQMPPVLMLKAVSKLRNRQLFVRFLEDAQGQEDPLDPRHLLPVLKAALPFEDAELLFRVMQLPWKSSNDGLFGEELLKLISHSRSTAELDACQTLALRLLSDKLSNSNDQIMAEIEVCKAHLRDKKEDAATNSVAALRRQENRIVELIEKLNRLTDLATSLTIRDLAMNPLPRLTLQEGLGKVQESWQRDLYKEMHLDPLSRRQPYLKHATDRKEPELDNTVEEIGTPAAFTLPTGLSYAETRFEMFSGMNEIMLLAWASKNGPKKRNQRGKLRTETEQLEALRSSSLLNFDSEQAWKERIRTLRRAPANYNPK